MALIDLFLRAHWAQKILFLADRDALVEQALTDGFKAHLPHEPRVRIHTANIDTDKRLYVATAADHGRCFEKFSPGFFDLDHLRRGPPLHLQPLHRGHRILRRPHDRPDRHAGRTSLTATLSASSTATTRRPTFLYTYQQAVAEKRLVDFRLYQAQTGFQRKGIKGADLSEEDRNALIEQGIDPDHD